MHLLQFPKAARWFQVINRDYLLPTFIPGSGRWDLTGHGWAWFAWKGFSVPQQLQDEKEIIQKGFAKCSVFLSNVRTAVIICSDWLPVYNPCPFTFLGLGHGRFIPIPLQNNIWGSAVKEDPVNAHVLGGFCASLFHWVHNGFFCMEMSDTAKAFTGYSKSIKRDEMGH